MPRPHDVKDSAEFVAVMRQLRQWADLSYRELERRAGAVGDVLPRATLSGVLSRKELPREDLLSAFVRACGGDEAAVEDWVKVRKRLAVETERQAGDAVSPADSPSAAQESGQEPPQEPRQDPHSGSVEEAPDVADDEASDGDAASAEADDTDTAEAAGEAPKPVTGPQAQEIATAPPSAAEPASDVASAVLAEEVVRKDSATAPRRANSAPAGSKAALRRRARRGGVAVTAAAAIVLLAAAATGILRPSHDTAEPQDTRTSGPVVTVSPEKTASRSPADGTSSSTVPKPIKDEPEPGRTRDAVQPDPAKKTTRSAQPQTTPSSRTPQPPPYEPPASYEPPPSTYTPPQDDGGSGGSGGGGGDPFPEETCWDATNDCV
ncbi:helix-turn-helix domain-containing protein [Streptomyces sp. NPDC059863]|uniref:helix-turn-helix domain-containing protein n=1 Tax=unclassified Streptomyces TaxID=2593676 RepID=UPI00364C7DB1